MPRCLEDWYQDLCISGRTVKSTIRVPYWLHSSQMSAGTSLGKGVFWLSITARLCLRVILTTTDPDEISSLAISPLISRLSPGASLGLLMPKLFAHASNSAVLGSARRDAHVCLSKQKEQAGTCSTAALTAAPWLQQSRQRCAVQLHAHFQPTVASCA